MKKHMKRLSALVLALAVCLALALPAFASNTEGVTFSASLDQTEVTVGTDEAVTVEMTAAMSAAHLCDSIEYVVVSNIPGFAVSLKTDSLGSSYFDTGTKKLGWMSASDVSVQTLGVFTITIPAGTAAGSYTVGIENAKLSANMTYWEQAGAASATVTVTAPASYSATFAAGEGGSGTGPAEMTGSKITLPDNTFTNSDATKSFVGWKSGADNVTYPAGAKVTLTGDTVFTAQWATYALELRPNVTEVGLGGSVEISIVSTGTAFHAYDLAVTYDSTKFTTTDSVTLKNYDQTLGAGGVVATLTFTATSDTTVVGTGVTGLFGFSKAQVAQSVAAMSGDAVDAATTGCQVSIVPKYIVRFFAKDGTTQIGDSFEVAYNATLAAGSVPTAATLEHYTFTGWKSSADSTVYTAAQVAAKQITAAVDFTAQYDADTYTVSKSDGITGPEKATYGQDYEGTVSGAPSDDYSFTVTATLPDGSTVDYAVDETTGKFTIPAAKIDGDTTKPIALQLNKTLKNVAVKTYADYVGGYTLVVAYGAAAKGYTYDGEAMYRTSHYDADAANTVTGGKAYAWIVSGAVTDAAALAKLELAAADAAEATAGNDVNATGKTDIADVQAVADCYNVKGAPATYMAVYLRADVNASHVVDTTDANAVLSALT